MQSQFQPHLSAQPTPLTRLLAGAGLVTFALVSMPAAAMEFKTDDGVQVKANATITFGSSYRAEDQDPGLLGALSATRARHPRGPTGWQRR